MSVEVLSAGESESPDSASGRRVRGLANEFYNLFMSDAPGDATSTLPPPMLPTPLTPTTTAPKPPKPPKPPRAPAPTGCAMSGVTKSVVVVAGINGKHERLKAAMERTKPLADLAREKGNQVHYAFLGGALPPHGAVDEKVVDWLLALKRGSGEYGIEAGNVHLVVGPREVQALSSAASKPETPLHAYLKASKFIECLGPEDMDKDGTGGLWLKSTSTQGGTLVGKLPGIGVMGANGPRAEWIESPTPLSAIEWKEELNKRWTEVANDPRTVREEAPNRWQFWMTLGVQSALDEELLPAQGLDTGGRKSLAVFARQTAAFGTVRRTLRIDRTSMMMMPDQCWMDVGVTSDSLYWAVQTWCYGTMRAMNEHKLPMLDRMPTTSELQYDVSCTLGSLVQHAERTDALTPPVHPWANFGKLVGQLGPCVCGGRDGQEVLRVVHWAGPGMPDVLMLLPEAYVRYALSDYYRDMLSMTGMGARAVAGFLVLEDHHVVPMRLPDVSEAEQADVAQTMGARVWKLPAARDRGDVAVKEMVAAPPAWRQLLKYKVAGAPATPDLVPGQRIDSASGRHIFYTHTTSADPLAGLFVKWVFAPGSTPEARDMPTLDLCNDQYQTVV